MTNFILSLFSVLAVLIYLLVFFWKRVQKIRKELREKPHTIFPIEDKLNNSENIPISPIVQKSATPASLLAHSLTSADFAAKTLLDKKVFAASGTVNKINGGLKDLI